MQWTQEAADIWHSKCTNKSTSVPSLVRAKPKRLRGCSSGPCMWHLGPRSTWRFFKTETNSLVQTGLVGTGWKVWRQLPSSPGLLGALDNSILNPLVNCLRPPRLASPYRTLASWLFFLLIRSFLPTTGAVFVLNSDLSSSISKYTVSFSSSSSFGGSSTFSFAVLPASSPPGPCRPLRSRIPSSPGRPRNENKTLPRGHLCRRIMSVAIVRSSRHPY